MPSHEESATEQSPLLSDSSQNSIQESPKLSLGRGFSICLSIWVLIFILTSNVSLIATIQSSIVTDLEIYDSGLITWLTAAYLIAVTSLTPVAGRLSQIFTARIYLFASAIVQCCGLLITSQARTIPVFLLGRAVAGAGSAAITPVAFILVTDLTDSKKRGLFFGCINTAYTSGVACGAIIAGALEPTVGWRAVFWVQIPVSFAAACLAFFSIPHSSGSSSSSQGPLSQKLARIDYFGILTLTSSVVLLLYGLSAHKIAWLPIVLAFADLALFVMVESKWATDPIVPIHVMASRANLFTGLATIGIMTARWSILFYTPVYAIAVRGWSQASAGLMLVPTNAGFAAGGLIVGWLHIRRASAYYVPSLLTIVFFSATTLIFSQISTPNSSVAGYVCSLAFNGFVTGAMLNYTLAHVLHLTLPETHVIVIPLLAMFRGLSGSFGSAITGGIFLRSLRYSLENGFRDEDIPHKKQLILRLLGTPKLVQQLDGIEHQVALQSYITAFRTLFIAGSILSLLMLVFQAATGWTAPKSHKDDASSSSLDEDRLSPVVSREAGA
jgi:MFS family permease